MRIGFTGTADGMTKEQERSLSVLFDRYLPVEEFHHGDCVGADAQAHNLFVFKFGDKIPPIIHPPEDDKKRAYCRTKPDNIREPKPYLDRNHDIVDETDYLIATPKTTQEIIRSGTWATVRYARRMGKRIFIIWPNGSIKHEN